MLFSPEDHPKHPPHTWTVEKRGRRWALTVGDSVIDTFATKREAEENKISGMYATLYEKERRWFAGERVDNWKPYVAKPATRN
jgi:hypothetical protein